jgi:hypothetical protein
MQWNPRRLPRMRQQMAAYLQDPDSDLLRGAPKYASELATLGRQIHAADLYWVMPDMGALAMGAAGQLADVRFTPADRPSGIGLAVFDGGAGSVDYQGAEFPVDALSWGPALKGMRLWQWIRRSRREEALRRMGGELGAWMPPLLPAFGGVLSTSSEATPVEDLSAELRTSATTLAAAWHLMEQPRLVDRSRLEPDRKERRSLARAGDASPDVTLVDLRRQYVPQDRDGGEGEQGGRRYRHRWVVSGHWRDQPYGPERALRRKTWIPAYVKGPDGAPMLTSEKVNVWKR